MIGRNGRRESVESGKFGAVGEGVVADEAVEVGKREDHFHCHAEFGSAKYQISGKGVVKDRKYPRCGLTPPMYSSAIIVPELEP
jgi:hypothetical protein